MNVEQSHEQDDTNVYLSLLGNLSLWSVISNESSFGKIGHEETGSLHCEIRRRIDLYKFIVAENNK